MSEERAQRAVEAVARASYGRLVAILTATTRDIAAAEDALSEAFAAALRTWPERGIPEQPDAWLLTAARNARRNASRHQRVVEAASDELVRRFDEATGAGGGSQVLPDRRLELLFLCAHPAIDEAIRTPLMLQVVLGLDAERIAGAFLVPAKTMGQRLVRAKTKIRDAGLRFAVPEPQELSERLTDVLSAIYVAYGTGWDDVLGAEGDARGLSEEAIWLGRLLVSLLPHEPEPEGLLALMLYCESRRAARRDATGAFVPLDRQDPRLWSRDMIIEAETHLTSAARHARFGRFQCEAAIQSVHVQRPITGRTNHVALRTLYDLLASHVPSMGVLIARAAAIFDGGDVQGGLSALDAIEPSAVASHQPYWVTRARIEEALGRRAQAKESLTTAIELTRDAALRAFLIAQVATLEASG